MRWPLVAILGCLIPAAAAAADPHFPYKAYVTADDVHVRSGPGENYYPTDQLKQGQEVEVYRHDPGGWYAIRPPRGSFSWVSSRHLQADRDGLATVTEDRIAARVGSRFSDVRDVIQVRLHRGELVELLDGKPAAASAAAANPWCKIAPPSGEFRWVSAKFVDPDFPRDGVRRTRDSQASASAGPSGPAAPRHLSAEQYQTALNDLDIELSTMVIGEPAVWDFGELRPRAQTLFDQAETAVERGRARMLVSKIARFEDIKRRSEKVAALRQEIGHADRLVSLPAKNPLNPPSPTDPDGRFDAVGQLVQVQNPKAGTPQYAVVDAAGNVRSYISPAPGVNLRSYVGRQVGITGIRGYMPEQHAAHIMARHVSVVDGTVVGGNPTVLR